MMPTWKSKIAYIWSYSQKVAERRRPLALFVFGMLAYAAAFAWHMLATFDLVNMIRDANYDDSFYYFQIAYNLSQGKFSTFDGGITQTNGYHPVWLLLITPFYWMFDKETALFGIKAFEIMLVAGGAALIALAAYLARLAWPLLFAALPMLYRNPIELLWGMEAAAAMFTLSLLILVVCLYMRDSDRWKWPLAALAFALPWVRIEYIAISLAVTAALCVIEWSRQEPRALRLSELARIPHAHIPLIGAIAGILVYFAYNGLVFSGILPVSAATELAWSQANWAREGGYVFIENFRYVIRLEIFDNELLIALEICAYLLLAWRLALRSNERRDWLLVAFLVGVFGLAAGHLAKFAQTILTVHPDVGSSIWYFVPAYLMTALIIPVRLYIAILLIRRFLYPQRRTVANALSIGVVVIGATLLLGRSDFVHPFKWVEQEGTSTEQNFEITAYTGTQVINRALPEDAVIGSWHAGVIGYFSRFPVVNLDGLVNSYEYHNIIRQNGLDLDKYTRLADPQVVELVRHYGITHFANARQYDLTIDNVVYEGIPLDSPYGEYRFTLWTYNPAPGAQAEIDHSQQIWDNMQPRFDYSANGIGVILAGRTAQAIAKDCAPDEPLIWTWNEPKYERSVTLESIPYRSRTNMCIDSRILPHSAGRSVQARLIPIDLQDLTSREPIIRSNFYVYRIDRSLIYAKTDCGESDVQPRFFANLFPDNPHHLPVRSRQNGYETLDFDFHDYGAISNDGRCLAAVSLPEYPIAAIEAGQYVEDEDAYSLIWVDIYGEIAHAGAYPETHQFERLDGREPIIRSNFDVYIIGDNLIYAKTDCGEADVEANFFTSIFPLYPHSLAPEVRQRGYDAIDFGFYDYGAITDDGRCWAEVDLPNYPIAEIHAGQYVELSDGYAYIWESDYRLE